MNKNEYKLMYQVEDTHFWYEGMRKITKSLLDQYLQKNKKLKILDAGCGTGKNMVFLKSYGKVFGFDISKEAMKFCKKRLLKDIKVGSVDKIPYKNNCFDLVTCFDVLGQIEVKNTKNAINELYRVLKPGGILLIRIAAYDWLKSQHDVAVHTKHRFEKKELNNLLINNKLKIIRSTYLNMVMFPIALIKRLFSKNNSDKKYASDVNFVTEPLNSILKFPFVIENELVKNFNLPYGLSLVAIAKKSK